MKFRLKEFRQAHKLFQSDMAELLNANQSTISRMELRHSCKMSQEHLQILYNKYGEEEVNAFMEKDENFSVEVTGNTNEGDGTQNNGYFGADATSLAIIRQQSEALTRLATKQAEQTDRLIVLLEKLQEKL